MAPVLHDAVTLQTFGAIGRLDICVARHGSRPEPRWTEAVHDEIARGAAAGLEHCQVVMAAGWLGAPVIPDAEDQLSIYRLQVGLNDGRQPPTQHLGEAESIYFAEKLGGSFVTDDNGAYDFAIRRQGLGPGRVFDTVDVLRNSVADGDMTAKDALGVARAIEAQGRFLRRVHESRLLIAYFDQ